MRLRHIEIFHAIYSTGTVTAAARILNVTQPSVSKVLAHAEQTLGYALFDRVKGKLVPTQEAERLIGYVSGVYQNIGELRRVAENLRASDTGRIRIIATPAFGIDVIPGAIAAYLKDHAETVFEIETSHYRHLALHGLPCAGNDRDARHRTGRSADIAVAGTPPDHAADDKDVDPVTRLLAGYGT